MQHQYFKALLEEASKTFNQNKLVYDTLEKRSLNYSDCYTLTEHISKRLSAKGIHKGEIVINYLPLSIESVLLCWACLNNGIIFLPIDHNWPAPILKQIIEETSPRLIFTDISGLNDIDPLFPRENILVPKPSENEQINSFYEWLDSDTDSLDNNCDDPNPEDIAIILYTSGSTGVPKGVVLTQKALCLSGQNVSDFFEWQASDKFMNLGDLHSMSGLRNTCIAPLFKGSSMVIAQVEERNSILSIIEVIEQYGIQYLGTSPIVVRQMNLIFSDQRQKQISSLKAILCTGGALARDQLSLFYKLYHKPIYNYYGLTETGGICSGHNANSFSSEDNSIGKPINAEFIIKQTNSNENKNIGELLVKSDQLMHGYYKNEAETSKVLKDGCFYTGDIVQKRPDGCFELLGRKKNIIKNIHSELIHLEEIDLALESHLLVKEACACPYIPYEEDERIIAFIAPLANLEITEVELIENIKTFMNKLVGKNRAPWDYRLINKIPRNTSGKVERKKLVKELND